MRLGRDGKKKLKNHLFENIQVKRMANSLSYLSLAALPKACFMEVAFAFTSVTCSGLEGVDNGYFESPRVGCSLNLNY